MKRTTIAACMALMVAAGSVTGCSSQTGTNESSTTAQDSAAGTEALQSDAAGNKTDGVTITFWHSMGGVNGEAINTLVEQFNKENTDGITVEAQYQGSYDDAINKLKSAQIGNMGADLVQIYDIGTRFMIDSGWVVPMQDLIDGEGWDLSQVEPNIAAYYTVDDILYSMPFNSSTPILYYNRDMFERFRTACRRSRRQGTACSQREAPEK